MRVLAATAIVWALATSSALALAFGSMDSRLRIVGALGLASAAAIIARQDLRSRRRLPAFLQAAKLRAWERRRFYASILVALLSYTLLGCLLVRAKIQRQGAEVFVRGADATAGWQPIASADALRNEIPADLFAFFCVAGIVFVVVTAWIARKAPGRPAERRDVLIGAPLTIAASLLASFLAFYSIDGSFTRLGGTTTYCYPNGFFAICQPLMDASWRLRWEGGGPLVRSEMESRESWAKR